MFFDTHVMLQSENHYFYHYESIGNPRKFRKNFGENFTNSENSRKKFLRKISRKFRGLFSVKCNDTERKSSFLMFVKGRKIRENSGRNFRKISEIPKIRENFPGKFPENSRKIPGKSGGFLRQNAMIQSENHVFHR